MRYLRVLFSFLFLMLATMAFAAPQKTPTKKCPPKCKHRTEAKSCPVAPTLGAQLLQAFELNAGFRWQTEHPCPTLTTPDPPSIQVKDPFYLGAGLRLPLSENTGLFGNFDRDFTQTPEWQARVGGYWRPFHE